MLIKSDQWKNDVKDVCLNILKNTIKEENKYQLGLTKLFFRAGMLAYLEQVRGDRINFLVTLMQKNFLRSFHQNRYRRIRVTILGIQSLVRRKIAIQKKERAREERAVLLIQKVARAFLCRQAFLKTRLFVVQLQSRQSSIPYLLPLCLHLALYSIQKVKNGVLLITFCQVYVVARYGRLSGTRRRLFPLLDFRRYSGLSCLDESIGRRSKKWS
jgi:myosin heavy subunit